MSPFRIKIDDNSGKIYVNDARRWIKIYDKGGNFVRQFMRKQSYGSIMD